MRDLILATLVIGLAACGGQDSQLRETIDAVSDVAAGEAAGDAAGAAANAMRVDPSAKSCLQLVTQAAWAEAVPTCTEAVSTAPDNTELHNALATAKSNSANQASGAVKSAADDARALLGQ